MLNALSIDVEEWFHICRSDRIFPRNRWDALESRVVPQTERVLRLLPIRATFFILGWVAERHPYLVRTIVREGHELASHGYGHYCLDELGPEQFDRDLGLSIDRIVSAGGVHPRGYRAPGWSLTEKTLWALDRLADRGFDYDSSLLPWGWSRERPPEPGPWGRLWEFPGTPVSRHGILFPGFNGRALRLRPVESILGDLRRLNARGKPVVVAFHPWELDCDLASFWRPFPAAPLHTLNRGLIRERLRRILAAATFGCLAQMKASMELP